MTEKIVLTLTKHPLWGHVLQPVLVEENEYGKLEILEYADSKSSGFSQLNELSKEIILLSEKISDTTLMENYSKEKEKTIAAFHRKVKKEMIDETIRPYIEKLQHQILLILNESELPLYVRENVKIRNLYETNLAVLPTEYAKVVFNFTKEEEENACIHYSLRIKWQDEELDLFSQPYFQLSSEPAALVINKKVLLFNDIDIKKLIPFFTKREINIPLSYEKAYIKTFIKNCVENHEVISEGIDIHKIEPKKKAQLLLDTDSDNMPVLNLTLNYEEYEYQLDDLSGRIVQPVEHDGKTALTWFNPDKEWENKLICILLENGLEKTGPSHFSLKKNKTEILIAKQIKNMTEWIRKHTEVMEHFEFNHEMTA
ncbi:MAG: hypothetical protein PHS30_03405 [Bacteroidales bacterium]|nr:hypothetical protein [Bacteroidales bacterium]